MSPVNQALVPSGHEGTFQAHKRWKRLAKALFRCYPAPRSGAMCRPLVLLLLAAALMVPTAGGSVARTDALVKPEASTAAQLAAPSNAKRMAIPCRGCMWKACGVSAIGCGACVANALLPVTDVLATITPAVTGPSGISALRDHHGPPDPYPPRPIVIS